MANYESLRLEYEIQREIVEDEDVKAIIEDTQEKLAVLIEEAHKKEFKRI